MDKEQRAIVELMRKVASPDAAVSLPHDVDWMKVIGMSSGHGVLGVCFKAVEMLPADERPDMDSLMEMVGQVEHVRTEWKGRYDIAREFAAAVGERGVRTVVLKGFAFGQYWRVPEMRASSDVDVVMVKGERDGAVSLGSKDGPYAIGNEVAERLGAKVDYGHYKHSHIHLRGVMIENHRYMTDFQKTRRGVRTERLLREVLEHGGVRELGQGVFGGQPAKGLWVPNDMFNALFLMKHAQGHFLSGEMSLKMLWDWIRLLGFVSAAGQGTGDGMDWGAFRQYLEGMHSLRFAEVMTGVCRKYMGVVIPEGVPCSGDDGLIDAMMEDVLRKRADDNKGTGVLDIAGRVAHRLRRRWRWRVLDSEVFPVVVFNAFAFGYYMHRKVDVEF